MLSATVPALAERLGRLAPKNTKKRVVGMLLGEYSQGVLDVTNSYAVPFEEDERDPSIWFLDHSFHEAMFSMFKKVSHITQ